MKLSGHTHSREREPAAGGFISFWYSAHMDGLRAPWIVLLKIQLKAKGKKEEYKDLLCYILLPSLFKYMEMREAEIPADGRPC